VYQLELFAGSVGKWGMVSEEQSDETTALSAGTAEQDVGTAAAQSSHLILQSGRAYSAVG
jgi:hypothetical protein